MYWRRKTISLASDPRGFTLVEMIVVLVILGILISMTVPRFAHNETRSFKLAIEEVSDLLTMFAQRENLGQKVVGIYHERSKNELHLLQIDRDSEDEAARWMPDPFVEPIQFPRFMSDTDIEIVVDGDWIDASEWPVTAEVGQHRPTIEIILRGAGESARLVLSSHGVSPVINTNLTIATGTARSQYDLDNAGRGREDW